MEGTFTYTQPSSLWRRGSLRPSFPFLLAQDDSRQYHLRLGDRFVHFLSSCVNIEYVTIQCSVWRNNSENIYYIITKRWIWCLISVWHILVWFLVPLLFHHRLTCLLYCVLMVLKKHMYTYFVKSSIWIQYVLFTCLYVQVSYDYFYRLGA